MSQGEQILVADDSEELRRTTAELLRQLGYRTLTAADGRSALSLIEQRGATVDVLLTDYMMPGMDGLELIQAARRRCPGLPAVLASTRNDDLVGERRLQGADFVFLSKPFSSEALRRAVREAQESPAATDRVAERDLATPGGPAAAQAPRRGAGEGSIRGAAGRSTLSWQRLAAALLVAAGAGGLLLMHNRPPGLPDRVELGADAAVRGGAVDLLFPLGRLSAVPDQLQWMEVSAADHYRVVLEAVDGEVLWSHEPRATAVRLPPELRGNLHAEVVYHWRVWALDDEGRTLAASRRARFQVTAWSLSDGAELGWRRWS